MLNNTHTFSPSRTHTFSSSRTHDPWLHYSLTHSRPDFITHRHALTSWLHYSPSRTHILTSLLSVTHSRPDFITPRHALTSWLHYSPSRTHVLTSLLPVTHSRPDFITHWLTHPVTFERWVVCCGYSVFIYSETCLTRTPFGQKKMFGINRCSA